MKVIGAFSAYHYQSARQAGIDVKHSLKVARGEMTLTDALGEMDCDAECGFMEMVAPGPACVVATGAACNCVGEEVCDDCIPF